MSTPGFYDDLEATLAEAWALLTRGVHDRQAPAHLLCVATTDEHGLPALRTVVLRRCSPQARQLVFHTDTRSAKWRQLERHPALALLVYDPRHKIQLRLSGRAVLEHEGAQIDSLWASLAPMSQHCYGVSQAPGSLAADPQAALQRAAEPAGRAHFGLVTVRVQTLEWLFLAARGHRRARFDWRDDGWEKTWLVP
jgi:pyridoxine/pyridoxamine 5'-phosphate oxidase